VLPEAFVAFPRIEKEADPRASSPELIRRAQELGMLRPQPLVDRIMVWRANQRMELAPPRRPHKREADTRRFVFPHRMMMVLAVLTASTSGPALPASNAWRRSSSKMLHATCLRPSALLSLLDTFDRIPEHPKHLLSSSP